MPRLTGRFGRAFGPVLKEGLYEDFERRQQLLGLARFKTTARAAAGARSRTMSAHCGRTRPPSTTSPARILRRLEMSPQLEGFRARGIEVLLLPDPVDSFWVTAGVEYEGKPFKSVTQGAADLALIPLVDAKAQGETAAPDAVKSFVEAVKTVLGDQVADVRCPSG